jgi:hypothetical protein
MIKAGCLLEAYHKFPESPFRDEPLDSPEALQRLKELGDQIDRARIVAFHISEAQAQRIVDRLWPNEGLLGATCGRGFPIETADQVSVVNEVIAPHLRIWFNGDKHTWFLQTWPEVVDTK